MGDKLSRGTRPAGDNRDTPKGGVSRLSRLRSGEIVPGLVVSDRAEALDGEPAQEWVWGAEEPFARTHQNPRIFPTVEDDGGGNIPQTINNHMTTGDDRL